MKKRIFSLLLAALMLASVSCGESGSSDNSGADTTESGTSGRLTELGAKDFGGKKFTVLDANDHPEMHVNIPGEEMNGDIVNDALYGEPFDNLEFGLQAYRILMDHPVTGKPLRMQVACRF
jgi:hypothetical protein